MIHPKFDSCSVDCGVQCTSCQKTEKLYYVAGVSLDYSVANCLIDNDLTTHSPHFIYGYMASDIIMVKDHSDSEKGNPLPPHRLLLSINSKGSFICTIPQNDVS